MTAPLPEPQGFKLLIEKPKPKEKTEGGILLPDQAIEAENYLSICAKLVKVGPLAWKDRETGTSWARGPWAVPGDWVIVPKFTQFRMEIDDKEYRFINDDEIIAVVKDPTVIKVYT